MTSGRIQRGQSQAVFSGAQWQDQRLWAQNETLEGSSEHQEIFIFIVRIMKQWNRLPEEVVEYPSLEIVQKNCPGQLGGPAWTGGGGEDELQKSLPSSTILWFCDLSFCEGGCNPSGSLLHDPGATKGETKDVSALTNWLIPLTLNHCCLSTHTHHKSMQMVLEQMSFS